MEEVKTAALLDTSDPLAGAFLAGFSYPWEALPAIGEWVLALGNKLSKDRYELRGENIWVAKSAHIYESAYLTGPLIVCEHAEIRHGAFIRGKAFIGEGAVVGNSTEVKNVVFFKEAKAPHYNYVGDSVLGAGTHLGAGAITSNFKADHSNVAIRVGERKVPTGLRKCGAILGDYAEIGCGCVLNPGTVIGRQSIVYPLSSVRGFVPAKSIYKEKGNIVKRV